MFKQSGPSTDTDFDRFRPERETGRERGLGFLRALVKNLDLKKLVLGGSAGRNAGRVGWKSGHHINLFENLIGSLNQWEWAIKVS